MADTSDTAAESHEEPVAAGQRSTARMERSGRPVILLAFVLAALGAGLEYPRLAATFTPTRVFFAGPDDYMRVWRAKRIAEGKNGCIRHIAQINAPKGAEMHWTSPMDGLLAGAGIVFGAFVQHPDPIGFIAACVPVVLGGLYVVCMIRILHRGFGWVPALLGGLMVVVSPAFHRVFQLGHPDHHALLELLFLIAVGAWLPRPRSDGTPGDPTEAAAAVSGLATGLGIWIASQALLVWGVIMVGVSIAGFRGSGSQRRLWVGRRFVFNSTTALMVTIGFFVENWPQFHVVAVDKISLIHLAMIAIGFLAPIGSQAGDRGETKPAEDAAILCEPVDAEHQAAITRQIALLLAIAAFVVWLGLNRSRALEYVSRPEFYRWSRQVMELQPLYTRTANDWSLRPLTDRLGFLPYALPVLLLFFIWSKRVPLATKWTVCLLASAITILTVLQRRWLDHFNVAMVPLTVIGICEMLRASLGRSLPKSPVPRFALAGFVLAVLSYPSARIVLSRRTEDVLRAAAPFGRSDFVAQQISLYEARHPASDDRRRAILCEDGEGPLLLYYTGLPVVATPYHRALDGLVEAARFFTEHDPLVARRQLDRLGVRYIVVPMRPHEQLMNLERIAFGELRSYDPPERTMDAYGRLRETLHYRPEQVATTMLYRLVMESTETIPGIELVAEIKEGAQTPDGRSGLLYVVHDEPASEER